MEPVFLHSSTQTCPRSRKKVFINPLPKVQIHKLNFSTDDYVLLTKFAGDSTLLINFIEHADNSDMALLLFNWTQQNDMKCNTSKIFFVVKGQSN